MVLMIYQDQYLSFAIFLLNLTLFQEVEKLQLLKQLFKKGSKTDPQTYRPISLPPLSSKIIERIVHETFLPVSIRFSKKLLYQHLSW